MKLAEQAEHSADWEDHELRLVKESRHPLQHRVVGSNDLGGSPHISHRHAVCRRLGPETWLESVGRNGTYRRCATQWIRFPDKRPILIQTNDRLRFANVETKVAV